MPKIEKSKPKLHTVYANDLFYEDEDGERTYPHYGEFVSFAPYASVDEMLLSEDIQQNRATPEDVVRRIKVAIAARVKAWDWTDVTGNPMPQPTAEVLAGLDPWEYGWMQRAMKGMAGVPGKDDEPGNSGITAFSTETDPSQRPPSSVESARSSVAPLAKRASRSRGK